MRTFVFLFFTGLTLFLAPACRREKVGLANLNCEDTVSFSATVADLINTNCAGCHGEGNTTGYTFNDHASISANATAILNSMRGEGGFQQMPDGLPALPDSMIQKFNCWMNQGKLNN